jgi:hypothetical protein
MYRLWNIAILIAVTVMLTQCTHGTVKDKFVFDTIQDEYASLQPAEFQKEIERLKGLSHKKLPSLDAARTHIQLAFLYSHYRNPLPDYYKALEHLRIYASIDPEGSRQDYIQNWLGMLKEIANLGSANRDITEKKEQLKEEIARILKENTKMSGKLDKLKSLDIELEQKRKLVK